MLRILIIDDNPVRVENLRCSLLGISIAQGHMDICSCAMAGRKLLRSTRYDFLLLDICIPRREGDRPSKEEGLNLMLDVYDNPKFILPGEVIGITEYDDIFSDVIDQFQKRMTHVVRYNDSTLVWKEQLLFKIQQKIKFNNNNVSKRHAVLTVHGIRTYGKWQNLLEDTIVEQGIDADVINFKYSFLPIFSYISYFIRNSLAKRFSNDLLVILDNKQYEIIDIVGHSFGTYLIAFALKNFEFAGNKKIRNVIFSGSVVPENFDWSHIIGVKIERLINDCAFDDTVLIVNKCFVPFGGMSGRVGFKGFDAGLINRFFKGGHDAFYMRSGQIDNYFIKKYWIPLLAKPNHVIKYDERGKPGFFEDFHFIFHVICFLKNAMCILAPILIFFYFLQLLSSF